MRKRLFETFILLPLLLSVSVFLLGFDFTKHSVPVGEIQSGGPPKDGIPVLTDPKFVKAEEAGFLSDRDKILGVEIKGAARAYPVKILNWHEAINDTLGGTPILATW